MLFCHLRLILVGPSVPVVRGVIKNLWRGAEKNKIKKVPKFKGGPKDIFPRGT